MGLGRLLLAVFVQEALIVGRPRDTPYGPIFTGSFLAAGLGVVGGPGFPDCQSQPACLSFRATTLCWGQMQDGKYQAPPGGVSRGHQGAR